MSDRSDTTWIKADLGSASAVAAIFLVLIPLLIFGAGGAWAVMDGGASPAVMIPLLPSIIPGLLLVAMVAGIRIGFDPVSGTVRSNMRWPKPTPYANIERVTIFPSGGGTGLAAWRRGESKPLFMCRLTGRQGSMLNVEQWRALQAMVAGSPTATVQVYGTSSPNTHMGAPALVLSQGEGLSLFEDQIRVSTGVTTMEPQPVAALLGRVKG